MNLLFLMKKFNFKLTINFEEFICIIVINQIRKSDIYFNIFFIFNVVLKIFLKQKFENLIFFFYFKEKY